MTPPRHAAPGRAPARTVFSIAVVLLVACGSVTAGGERQGPVSGDGRRVLFIGNSLTYVNDVPGLVQALADSVGVRLVVRSVAYPDYALEDHWARGDAAREIARGGWELVVMQQGPSSTDANRANLREWAKRFAAPITEGGGRPAMYAIWPSASRQADFARALESYALAAQDVEGDLYPVAPAWLAAWRRAPSLTLYASDGLHASPTGSYLAALVIAARITGRPAADFPTRLRTAAGATLDVGAQGGALLKEAATEVLQGAAPSARAAPAPRA